MENTCNNSNIFYTYAYLREDLTPYYIGKGKSYRAYRKNKNVHPPKDKSRIIFLKQNLTEEEAFKHEKYMIAVFGRKDLGTGILHNRTDGGEGTSGNVLSQDTKDKIGNYWRGKKRPGHGEKIRKSQLGTKRNPLSDEHKSKLRGRISPQKGKPLSDETKQKISQSKKGKPWTEARKNAQINRSKNDYN
ncbi:hypothetical protein PQC13_gp313 [Synechococcus phage S-SRM01]|uniref:Nuclease associated modular domain-containing protein n=1 Tax=Synechococcus phage S-SRM01 TaxID=2781608 RepID=A0A879R3U9_9CAUD|nr:hypothetical protein PQC13_gp313 [Synechococcus phage S-SRM01]QPX48278.1 hypothetical protein [Synechococcus phage S-SRM01]